MQKPGKILIACQHYPPDPTTTAVYVAAIARALAIDNRVVVLSGTPNSRSEPISHQAGPEVIEIKNRTTKKHKLVRRAIAISLLALRMFVSTLRRARRNDIVFSVTTPFTLPHGVMLAARLRGAATVLLIYDLYPEVLEAAGLIKSSSPAARLIRLANAVLFRSLDAIITIGRDVEPLLLAYKDVKASKINLIPNWTLLPPGYREVAPDNRFRAGRHSQLIVGLSGNLGFTHCPRTVFEAARLLKDDRNIHFLLSGWGVGWTQLKALQAAEGLGNVTLLEPVPEAELVEFLSSADVWVISYRRNIAGVSVPSRLYNLLAVGRAVIAVAEPQSEAALAVNGDNIGWVVAPEDPEGLANAIRLAASDRDATLEKGRRAAVAAEQHGPDAALVRYREVILNARNNQLRRST